VWTSLVVQEAGQVAQPAARYNPRKEWAEKKRQICREAAGVLIDKNKRLQDRPTRLAQRVEEDCLTQLERLGHRKTEYSWKTVPRYLRERK
jgi:hypothetical protein